MGWWFFILRSIADAVSKMGSPKIRSGAAILITAYPLKSPWTEIDARTNPKNSAPVSPIKSFAGLKLYGRKPKHAPARALVTINFLQPSLGSEKSTFVLSDL